MTLSDEQKAEIATLVSEARAQEQQQAAAQQADLLQQVAALREQLALANAKPAAQPLFQPPKPLMGSVAQTSAKEMTAFMAGGPPKVDWSGPTQPADRPANSRQYRAQKDTEQAFRRTGI